MEKSAQDNTHLEDDILECLQKSFPVPLCTSQLAARLPWISNLTTQLDSLVSCGRIIAHHVSFDPEVIDGRATMDTEANQDANENDGPVVELYSLPNPSSTLLTTGIVSNQGIQGQLTILSDLETMVEAHGVALFDERIFPSITRSSVESELQTWRTLRDKYVARLSQLNQAQERGMAAADTESDEETLPEDLHGGSLANLDRFTKDSNMEWTKRSAMVTQGGQRGQERTVKPGRIYGGRSQKKSVDEEVGRLEEHKKTKLRVRQELKELLQATAGLLAEHRNLRIAEVIADFKQRATN